MIFKIGDPVRVLRVPGEPEITCPFEATVIEVKQLGYKYVVKRIHGTTWFVNESDLEPIERKEKKTTISIREFNKASNREENMIQSIFYELMMANYPEIYNKPFSVKDVFARVCKERQQQLLDAGYAPAPEPIDWSKVELWTPMKCTDCDEDYRFLKYYIRSETKYIECWNVTKNYFTLMLAEECTLAEAK